MTLMTFEQPTSEVCRVLLRLERLFDELAQFSGRIENLPVAMRFLIDIISVLDRPDLKSKITQELHRFIAFLSKLQLNPGIDHAQLEATLQEFQRTLEYVGGLQGKLGQTLRDHEFLGNIRLRIYTPAGDCGFELPMYPQWLAQDEAKALKDFRAWQAELEPVQHLTHLLLKLIREGSEFREIVAEAGFYHETLTNPNCQLLRLTYDTALGVYPEISVGKHRLSLRFYNLTLEGRPAQSSEDIRCRLACCCV